MIEAKQLHYIQCQTEYNETLFHLRAVRKPQLKNTKNYVINELIVTVPNMNETHGRCL